MTVERSSPLAALQPTSTLPYWNMPSTRAQFDSEFLRPFACQPSNFNFKDLSMRKTRLTGSDYFSRPIRGSSPSMSLAADLSQNCHIDQSPQVDTPRRSLFVSLGHGGPGQEVVTPPVPSSSPGIDTDLMEMSPLLPHKVPAAFIREADSGVLTPDPTPIPDLVVEPTLPRPVSLPVDLEPSAPLFAQRRISSGSRPSLCRKGFSFNTAAALPTSAPIAKDSQFIFGSRFTGAAVKPSLEAFIESPPSERKLTSSTSSSSLLGPSFETSVAGSPVALPRRPPTSRGVRPNGFARRTQSMQYSNPTKPVREGKRSCTTGLIMQPNLPEVEHDYKPKLPHFRAIDQPDSLPRISPETLVNLQKGFYSNEITEYVIVDCRFEYEYQGGHIDGAINFNDKDKLSQHLFADSLETKSRKALILHCEYSNFRAPETARHVRHCDRGYNVDSYPNLTFPEMYVLDGGYKSFFNLYRDRCFPQSYTQMHSAGNEEACENGMAKVRQRRKLSRAHTFAFGQHDAPSQTTQTDMRSLSAGTIPPSSPFGSFGFHDIGNVDAMDIDSSITHSSTSNQAPTTMFSPPKPYRLSSF